MNVVVCVKHAVDESELKADGSGRPLLQGAQAKMSVFDRNAVEEGVRIRESKGGTVTILSVGEQEAKKTIKEALAMGADKGVAVIANPAELDTLMTSYLLAKATKRLGPADIVLCSEGSSDTYHGQVGPMLAEWLCLPFFGYARKVEIGQGTVRCEQALEDRVEVLEARLPAVISVVSEINEPRYPTLLQIMQASKKPLEEVKADSLRETDAPPRVVQVLDVKVQSMSRKNVIFEDPPDEAAEKLVEALRREGVVKA
jgi:electron transfer flavoprotein beta subunit